MAGSRFEYVRQFEVQNVLLPNTYIVVRVDGKGFTKFTTLHQYEKPNDLRGIKLMNKCAEQVTKTFPEIWIAYGQSDEYSFVFKRKTQVFNRRAEKIISCVASCFSSSFALFFPEFFKDSKLTEVPMFDSRCVCYPTDENLRDYLSWRQADCHINNLYNTCFWALVQQDKKSTEEAHKLLKNTLSGDKNELLFSKFGINYNKIDAIYRKGTILLRITKEPEKTKRKAKANKKVANESNEDKQINQKKDPSEKVPIKAEPKEEEKESPNNTNDKTILEDIVIKEQKLTVEIKDEQKSDNIQEKEKIDKDLKDVSTENLKVEEISEVSTKQVASDKEILILHEDLIQASFWEKYKEYTLL